MKRSPKAKAEANPIPRILWIISICFATLGVFWLPWILSPSTPVSGESYTLGFNNKIAILALGAAIFTGAAARYFGAKQTEACQWLADEPRLFPAWREGIFEYAVLIVFSGILCAAIAIWSSYIRDAAWCEARSFIYGMDLVTMGQVPYRDFMSNYGPSMIYLPYWLANLTGGGLSFEQSYTVALIGFTVAGFVCIFVLLRSFELPKAARPLILAMALAGWMCMTLGIQYAPLRFLCVPAAVIFLDAAARKRNSHFLWLGIASVLAVGGCLAISPEMGIAATAAVMAYGFVFILRRSPREAVACWIAALGTFGGMLVCFPKYLLSVLAFSAGGDNFPIYPNATDIGTVVASVLVISGLLAAVFKNPAEKRAPLALGLAVGGGMLLPAAFGRCDPGHVAINTVAPMLLMFPAAAAMGKGAFRTWVGVYAALNVILLQFSYWTQYTNNYNFGFRFHKMYDDNPAQVAEWKTQWDKLRLANPNGKRLYWSKVLPFPGELSQLTARGKVAITDGNEGNLWLARYLLLQTPPSFEYYNSYTQGAATPSQIDMKVQQSLQNEYLLMPENTFAAANGTLNMAAYGASIDAMIGRLLFFPVSSEPKHRPYYPFAEVARRLLTYYHPLQRYQGYIILEKNHPGT